MLSTAKMVLLAVRLATVCRTSILALDHPLGANEVWQAQRVLRDVWLLIVAAEAAVGEGFRVTSVDFGGPGFDLLADKGTCSHFLLTPGVSDGDGHTVGFNVIVGIGYS